MAPGATDEDSPLRITADLLLANDTDADGNKLTISAVSGTSERGATVTLNQNGSVTYDPTASADLNALAVGETLQDTFTYTLSDGMGGTDTATVTLTVAGANDPPVADDDAFGVDENSANGTTVGTVTAAGDSLTYAITGGNVGGAFAINPATGRITVADGSKLNYEARASYTLTVTVTDSHSASDTATITVDLNDVNEAPVVQNATFAVDENSGDGAFVGVVTAVDPDAGDSVSYEITVGNGDGAFAIDEATGEITVADGAQLDFEARPSYVLTVLVTDTAANTGTASVTVNVQNANEAPVANSDTFTVNERAANGTFVGVVTAADPDAGDSLHYAITEGNDDGAFAINALTGRITVADGAKLNYQDLASYDLAVTVTDSHGASDTAAITVDVNDLNDPPVAENDAFSVDENSGHGDYVGVVTASDPDADDALSYAITAVADPTQLNFEARAGYTLTVRVTDSAANTATATITVEVNDVNEAPIAQDGAFSVNEGAADGTVVGTVTASDPDAGESLSYEIAAGNDDGAFAIDGETGQITVADGTMLNFDTADSYTLTVLVTDTAANTATASITVNVNNVNEPPVADDDTFAVDENSDNGTFVGTVNATDSDAGDSLTYAITGGNVGGAFVIDSETGEITVADGSKLNFEARANYTLTVLVTDSADGAATATIIVDVGNVNEAPVNTVPAGQWAPLNGQLAFSAGGHNGISIADVDAGQNELAITLSVEHGTLTLASADGLTVIDGADGTECVTFTGSIAAINAALEGLTYTPEADYSGDDALAIVTDDQGNTGSGDAQSDTSTVDIVVNTPPSIASLDTEETVMRSRPLTLTAAADDSDGTVASVSFYRDVDQNGQYDEGVDELLGVDANGTNGWSWTGLTVDWPVGDQFFLAVAKDNQGAASEAAATSTTVTPYSLTWSNSTATVTVMDLVGGIDVSRANIAVSFTGARVNAITLKGVQPMAGLAIVIQGASSVGSIVDARRGVLGEVAFIASDSPVSNISIKGAVGGWNLNAQSFGGIDFSEDVDGDGGSDDLTGLFLGAGGVLRARKLGLTANVVGAVSVGSIRADVVAQSGLKSFRAVAGASDMDIVIASATGTASVSLGSAGNVNLSSEMNLTKLEAGRWAGGLITAPVISTLKITGLLTADIVLKAEAATTAMATMTVGGTMLDASLRSSGKVKSITVGGMAGSSILVGVNDEVTGLPQDRTDFADIDDATLPGIGSFTVRSGVGGVRFAHSNVAAWTIGMISLANVQKDTPGDDTAFGIATSSLKSYKRTEGLVTAYKWPNRASAWPMDDAGDFVISGL
ncbi:MAG: cadherin domain-containing protein [Planctomycetota bacterium]|nr:cadherin domain-containing protein [Planctomycetota bacterium]